MFVYRKSKQTNEHSLSFRRLRLMKESTNAGLHSDTGGLAALKQAQKAAGAALSRLAAHRKQQSGYQAVKPATQI